VPRLRLIGETRLPHKLQYQNSTLGGLSGIDFDAASGIVYLLSDDGGSQSPPRFYTARLAMTADKLGDLEFKVELTGVTYLQGLTSPDPEAIRWHAPSQSLLWTSEGNALLLAPPSLQQTRRDGTLARTFELPAMLGFGPLSGSRINKTLEGLTITPDGQFAWLAMEAALRQDGPEPTLAAPGGPCRFTQMDIATGKAVRQIAYVPDAIPRAPAPATADADNGVVEVLMLDAHRMLVRYFQPTREVFDVDASELPSDKAPRPLRVVRRLVIERVPPKLAGRRESIRRYARDRRRTVVRVEPVA
jgi:hypothetical protein